MESGYFCLTGHLCHPWSESLPVVASDANRITVNLLGVLINTAKVLEHDSDGDLLVARNCFVGGSLLPSTSLECALEDWTELGVLECISPHAYFDVPLRSPLSEVLRYNLTYSDVVR